MSDFIKFKEAVSKKLDSFNNKEVFIVDLDKDKLWDLYLDSFPEGTNPIYKERREYDCNCCKQFIRGIGAAAVVNGKNELESVWDIEVEYPFTEVVNTLSAYVKSHRIDNTFRYFQKDVGVDHNLAQQGDTIVKWEHFHYKLPSGLVNKEPGSLLSQTRAGKEVLERSVKEISVSTIDLVLDLIDQNSLYRGSDYKHNLVFLKETIEKHKKLHSVAKKDAYLWKTAVSNLGLAKVRNTAIGTLLVDLEKGVELEKAVGSFETMVAPANYKRPTALVTQRMLDDAAKTVEQLGIEDSLYRRHAKVQDVTINNVLFADRGIQGNMKGGVFGDIKPTKTSTKKFDKIEEVPVEDFINKILPNAESLELFVSNMHTGNLMSLVAPANSGSKNILKWDNNFSWSYNGGVTDSIKERVKKAGGNVEGYLRCSLSWGNSDDLDIHVKQPGKAKTIFFGFKKCGDTLGQLDVDMNAASISKDPVENIVWPRKDRMIEGVYTVVINNYYQRTKDNQGFQVEIETEGLNKIFTFDKNPSCGRNKTAIKFEYSKTKGIQLLETKGSETGNSKEVWGINTEDFVKVDMVMLSPNYWDYNGIGNKHWFFILDNCKNPEDTRGLYNEFLHGSLDKHRKVFELLGSKLQVPYSEEQLSGLGFSSTVRNEVLCKVGGSFNRVIKIKF